MSSFRRWSTKFLAREEPDKGIISPEQRARPLGGCPAIRLIVDFKRLFPAGLPGFLVRYSSTPSSFARSLRSVAG